LGIRRHGGWFEAMDWNCVLFGTNLDEERMRRATKNFVRARVGRSEGRMWRRCSNEDIGTVEEGRRNVRRSFYHVYTYNYFNNDETIPRRYS
jgi:hypothetical protein